MSLRVVQWATGSVGVAAIKGVLEHPELELVGCWVHSEAKSGKDVGEIIGCVPARRDRDQQHRRHSRAGRRRGDLRAAAAQRRRSRRTAALRQERRHAGRLVLPGREGGRSAGGRPRRAGNATLHGAGIGPGAATELFPLLLSVMSTGVTFVRAEEFSDLRTYGAPDVLRHVMGFGGTPDKALTGPMQKMLDGGFIQSVRLCVDRMGFAADPQIRTSQEIAVATGPIDSPIGVIEPGQVAGRRFHWEALVGDTVVVRITVNWLMGEENLDPPWSFGPAGERYEIEVRGNPDTFVTVKGWQPESVAAGLKSNPGVVATAAHCVNAIPATCAAAAWYPELLRPAADHRPGRTRAGAVAAMCRLFGLHAGTDVVTATFWLLDAPDNLAEQSRRNPDGTGLGVFDGHGQPQVHKEPIAAWQDADFATEAHRPDRHHLHRARPLRDDRIARRRQHPPVPAGRPDLRAQRCARGPRCPRRAAARGRHRRPGTGPDRFRAGVRVDHRLDPGARRRRDRRPGRRDALAGGTTCRSTRSTCC